jgi:hypothetical protein
MKSVERFPKDYQDRFFKNDMGKGNFRYDPSALPSKCCQHKLC